MEDVILIIILVLFFAVCYVATARFGRFLEESRNRHDELPEEKKTSGCFRNRHGRKTAIVFPSEERRTLRGLRIARSAAGTIPCSGRDLFDI